MTRYWIVALRFGGTPGEPPAPTAARTEGEPPCELASLLGDALDGVRGRVEGEVVLAAVPDTRLAALLADCPGLPPLHLVVPIGPDSFETCLSAPDRDSEALRRLVEAAASRSVPPGRGNSTADWRDCETWLDTITDLTIEIAPTTPGLADPAPPDRPRILLDPATGSIRFEHFPPGGRLVDGELQRLVGEAFGGNPPDDDFAEVKSLASRIANTTAPRFRFLQVGALLLNIAPGLLLATAAALAWQKKTTDIGKFTASLLAALAAIGLKRLGSRRRWLSARVIAEICRSVEASSEFLDPLFPPAARFLPRHAAVARSLTLSLGHPAPPDRRDLAAARDRYLQNRVMHQIRYYEGQARKACARRRFVRRLFYVATSLALVSTAAALLGHLVQIPWFPATVNERWIGKFATYFFPALAAASIGYLGIHESTRRADYYRELADRLHDRADLLARLTSESSITEAVREIESLLLEEVAGWVRRQVF